MSKIITRDEFIPYFALQYMQRHPEATNRYAKRMARLRWTHRYGKVTEVDLHQQSTKQKVMI